MEWIAHERAVLAGVLAGKDDHSPRWGLFRRRIGLRYDEPVPARLWSTAELRQDARSRLADGRYRGSLQQLEVALAELLDSAQHCSALDFPIACDLFQSAKARQVFYGALHQLLERRQLDGAIEAEIQTCRAAVNEATSLTTGYFRDRHSVLSMAEGIGECIALASMPLDQRPKPISTGIPSLDLDMRGGVIAGKGESTWVLAARSGIGKTTVAVAAAMGLAFDGALWQQRPGGPGPGDRR